MTKFGDAIDARFPYGDDDAAAAVIARGRRLSPADDTITLSEICRPPRSAEVGADRLCALVAMWAEGLVHPLKLALLECARAIILRQRLPCARVCAIMRDISPYRGLYAALDLAAEAADFDDTAGASAVEALEEAIRAEWLAKGG